MTLSSEFRISTILLICYCGIASSGSQPLAVYLQEGFDNPGIPAGWTVSIVSGSTATWTVVGTGTNPPTPPYAGTGQAKFNSYDAAPGDQSRLTSSGVNLSGSVDPFLTFHMYHDDEFLSSVDSVYVEASTTDSVNGPWTILGGFQRPGVSPGWDQPVVSLSQFIGSNRVFIGFRGVSQYGNNMYIDEVRIADSLFHDVGLVALLPLNSLLDNTPASQSANSRMRNQGKDRTDDAARIDDAATVAPLTMPMSINGIVKNFGTYSESSYQLNWRVDSTGQSPVTNTLPLPRNQLDTLLLSWTAPTPGTHTIVAWTSAAGDSNHSNDSLRLTVVVLDSTVFFAEMFNEPVFPPAGWTTINRDSSALPPWFQGTSTSKFVPYEGTGFAADNFQRANGTYIDDYLISPAIPGVAAPGFVDSLKFWVRSALNSIMNYPDSLMILISTTGTDTSDFTTFLDYFSVPKTGWTLKGYLLSGRVPTNSSVHIAFRYLHFFGGPTGDNSDFVGVDFVHLVHGLPTSASNPASPPSAFALFQNYPNPFNPTTTIQFELPEPANVQLKVFDVFGQEVETLVDHLQGAGTFRELWNGRNSSGSQVASGIYFYRLVATSLHGATTFSRAGKMLLLR